MLCSLSDPTTQLTLIIQLISYLLENQNHSHQKSASLSPQGRSISHVSIEGWHNVDLSTIGSESFEPSNEASQPKAVASRANVDIINFTIVNTNSEA